MGRRAGPATLVVVALLAAPAGASAHAALTGSSPSAGAELGATPAAVKLTFSEPVEPALSSIRIVNEGGLERQIGRAVRVSGKPLLLAAALPPLPRGVYTVEFDAVSAVDAHAVNGSFRFGVQASPAGPGVTGSRSAQAVSPIEVAARWNLLAGLALLLGASVAGVARFSGSGRSGLALSAAGWLVAVVGLFLLTEALRETARVPLAGLLATPVGTALLWRAAAIAVAGLALLVAWRRRGWERGGLALAGIAAIGAVLAQVSTGHAAAGTWAAGLTVSAQVVHFTAAGIWFGGLAALVAGIRGEPSDEKAAAIRRFGIVAGAALGAVVLTGTLRAIDEVAAWGNLVATWYGRAVLAKILLVAAIGAVAWRNRRALELGPAGLGPITRRSRIELGLGAAALLAAALLGTIAPPSISPAQSGLSAEGSDFGTTIRARLSTASDDPGPNTFEIELDDYDSGQPVEADRVSLRMAPLDDPWERPSTLVLRPGGDGTYAASGNDLRFDGRWEVRALIERGAETTEVPMEIELPTPVYREASLRVPGHPTLISMDVDTGYIHLSPRPERPGPNQIIAGGYNTLELQTPVRRMVITVTSPGGPVRQLPVRRIGPGRFLGTGDLPRGPVEVGVVADRRGGARLHGVFQLELPPE